MASAQPPLFQPAQNLAEMVSFLAVALAAGMVVTFVVPSNARPIFQVMAMGGVGVLAGFAHAWWSSRIPKPPGRVARAE